MPAVSENPPTVAAMFVEVTGPSVVVTVNVALNPPAGTVTLAGTATRSGRPLESVTTWPPAGAGEVSVTVPTDELPAVTLEGFSVSPESGGGGGGVPTGFTVSGAVSVTPPPETEIVTTVGVVTGWVNTSKPPWIDPEGMIIELFTRAIAGWLLASDSTRSVAGGDATVTRPNELPESPTTAVGFSVNVAGGCCGVSVIWLCTVVPFQLPVIVTSVVAVTPLVGIVNGAEKDPAGTSTVAGGLAAGELLDRLTSAPPAGAWPFSMTLPPESVPPLCENGICTDWSDGGSTVKLPVADTPFRVAVSVTGV